MVTQDIENDILGVCEQFKKFDMESNEFNTGANATFGTNVKSQNYSKRSSAMESIPIDDGKIHPMHTFSVRGNAYYPHVVYTPSFLVSREPLHILCSSIQMHQTTSIYYRTLYSLFISHVEINRKKHFTSHNTLLVSSNVALTRLPYILDTEILHALLICFPHMIVVYTQDFVLSMEKNEEAGLSLLSDTLHIYKLHSTCHVTNTVFDQLSIQQLRQWILSVFEYEAL